MKSLVKYISEVKKNLNIYEYLEDIIDSASQKPDIWDDTENWKASDDFDYYQDARGSYDDIVEFISEYGDDKCVAGWKTEKSFEETEKVIPKKLKDIMKYNKPEIPYKKNSNKMEVWETTDNGFDIAVMKFMNWANNNGTDYVEYWYMIAIKK